MQAREKLLINYSAPAACGGVKFAPMEFGITSQKAPRNKSGLECEESNYAEIHKEDDRRRRSSGGGEALGTHIFI